MTWKLEIIWHLIHRLADRGITVVCCGGAARDTYLGREPKDFDFIILSDTEYVDLNYEIRQATGNPCYTLGTGAEEYAENADARGLDSVYESCVLNITVQFLEYTKERCESFKGDPYVAVETLDCSLNMIFFEDVAARLIPRPHGEFPARETGNVNRFSPDVDEDRKAYIRAKFPEFNHK